MLSKKKIIMIISFIYWGLIIGNTISITMLEILEEGLSLSQFSALTREQLLNYSGSVLVVFFLLLFISIIENYSFTIIYFGAIVAIKKFYKEKTDITDKKTDNYYRDLLAKDSVGVLGYIRDFEIDESDLAATVLALELKGKIVIEDKIIVQDRTTENLESNEIYVLENLIYNNGKNIKISIYKNKVLEDCMKHNLLTEKQDFKNKRNMQIIGFVALMTLFILIFNYMPNFFNEYISGRADLLEILFIIFIFGSFIMMIITPSVFIVRLISYTIMSHLDPYVRNKKAMEINKKLNGLENFLKDFSIIHERNHKELKLWREYLIYSIIFDQNNDIKDEIIAKLKES